MCSRMFRSDRGDKCYGVTMGCNNYSLIIYYPTPSPKRGYFCYFVGSGRLVSGLCAFNPKRAYAHTWQLLEHEECICFDPLDSLIEVTSSNIARPDLNYASLWIDPILSQVT